MKSNAPRLEETHRRSEDPDLAMQELLADIEREPVPERLLILARKLQEALQERKKRLYGPIDVTQ